MDVRLSAQSVNTSRHVVMIEPALIIHFELEQIAAQYVGETAYLTIYTIMNMTDRWFTSQAYPNNCQMVLLDLHGTLSGNNTYIQGGTLLSPESLPLRFYKDREQGVQLTFSCSSQYIQQLEQERATATSGQDLRVTLRFWGTVMVIEHTSASDSVRTSPELGEPIASKFQQVRDIVPLLTSQDD